MITGIDFGITESTTSAAAAAAARATPVSASCQLDTTATLQHISISLLSPGYLPIELRFTPWLLATATTTKKWRHADDREN